MVSIGKLYSWSFGVLVFSDCWFLVAFLDSISKLGFWCFSVFANLVDFFPFCWIFISKFGFLVF